MAGKVMVLSKQAECRCTRYCRPARQSPLISEVLAKTLPNRLGVRLTRLNQDGRVHVP